MRRRLSNLLRDDEKRFHRSASAFLSRRGAAFHSSSRTFRRSPVLFQLSERAKLSASTTIFSFSTMICSRRAAFAAVSTAFLASYASRWPSIKGSICSTDAASASRSPTPLSSLTWSRNFLTAAYASDGTIAPLLIRAARSATSAASTSNFRTKYDNASSGVFPGYEPTAVSPFDVRT